MRDVSPQRKEFDDIVLSVTAVVNTIWTSWGTFYYINGCPDALVFVGYNLPLARGTLERIRNAVDSKVLNWYKDDVTTKSVKDGLKECLEIVRSMDRILCSVMAVQGSGISSWGDIIDPYRQMVESIDKGRNMETLLLSLLLEMRTLLQVLNSTSDDAALPEQNTELEYACNAFECLPASDSSEATTSYVFSKTSTANSSTAIPNFSKSSTASSAFYRARLFPKSTRLEGVSKTGDVDNDTILQPSERNLVEKISTIEEETSETHEVESDELRQPSEKELAETHNSTILLRAARSGNEEVVRDLLGKYGLGPVHENEKHPVSLQWVANTRIALNIINEPKDRTGRTPLSWAAGEGHLTTFRLLLHLRSDIESWDNMFRTPLSWAAREGRIDLVNALLDLGSNIKSRDHAGRTPLSWAAGEGHLTVVGALLKGGSHTESWDDTGRTPLSWAAGEGHIDVVKLLIKHSSDIESWDNPGWTPLSWAARKGHTEIVSHLIQAGADAKSKDKTGYTPLLWATENGHVGVVQQLLLVGDLKVADGVAEEAGWLPRYEDGSSRTADPQNALGKVDVNLHQPFCAHKLRKEESESIMHQSSDLRAQHLCRVDMQNQLSMLCGLAGVFPPDSNQSRAFGRVGFSIQEASVSFSDKTNDDLTEPGAAGELILQLHQAASGLVSGAIRLQQSGFCCNQFTVLAISQYEPGQSMIGMHTVFFDCLLKLEESITALRYEGLSDSIMSQCVSTSMNILERLFDVSLPPPSTIDLKFHYCSLAMQLLCLGLLLYSQAHVGTFHPAYLAAPINEVILRGSSPDQHHIIVEQRELACMGEMVGDKVFVFRIISQSIQAESKEVLGHLEATCEEIVDSWGPGSLLFASPDGLSEEKILGLVIRGGVVEPHGKLSNGDRLYHWGDQLVKSDPFLAETFGYRDRIVVGAVFDYDRGLAVNLVCEVKPEVQRKTQSNDHQKPLKTTGEPARRAPEKYGSTTVNINCKRDHSKTWKDSQKYRSILGTEPSAWKLVERNLLFQGGYQLILQAGAAQAKQPGVPGKRAVLDRWVNEKKLSLFEELHGLQVSLCTGVARRVPLRVLVRDDLMEYLESLPVPKWKTLKHQASAAMISKSSFEDWYISLDDESMTCVKEVFHTILHRLKDTGFDKNGVRFAIAWPNDSEARHCVKITPEGTQEWCRMFEDTEWSTTFAVATKLCLNAPSHKCEDSRDGWGGMKMLSTFVSESLSDKAPSTDDARSWQIEHNKWYWGGKVGGEILFLARKSPKEVAELEFHKCRLHLLPRRFWSMVSPRDVVKEIADAGDEGEDVFVIPRS